MTDRPQDEEAIEAEAIEIEAAADGPTADGPSADPEARAAVRRRRRQRLLLLLWLLPAVLILGAGYLVVGQPERLAAFLAGKPPDMATVGDVGRLADRVKDLEAGAADRAQVDAHAAALAANEDGIEKATAELAALRSGLQALAEQETARLAALDDRISDLEQAEPAVDPELVVRVRGLEERLAGIEERPTGEVAADGAADPALAELRKAVTALEARLDGLSGGVDMSGLEARLAAVDEAAADAGAAADKAHAELAALRAAVEGLAGRGEAGASAQLAAARLRFAVDTGTPFEDEMAEVNAAGDPGFGPWTERAASGLPTHDMLARQFKELARARTIRPDGPTGTPWLDDAIGRLSDVVSVRRVGKDLPGSGPDAALGRAEAHIDEGDLAAAVAAMGERTPPPFAGWLAAARDRLSADAELQAFTARAGR